MQEFRKQIDDIDEQLVRLLARRFELTKKVGEYKAEHNLPARDEQREAAQFARIEELAKEYNVSPELCLRLLEQIIDESVKLHEQIKREGQNAI